MFVCAGRNLVTYACVTSLVCMCVLTRVLTRLLEDDSENVISGVDVGYEVPEPVGGDRPCTHAQILACEH